MDQELKRRPWAKARRKGRPGRALARRQLLISSALALLGPLALLHPPGTQAASGTDGSRAPTVEKLRVRAPLAALPSLGLPSPQDVRALPAQRPTHAKSRDAPAVNADALRGPSPIPRWLLRLSALVYLAAGLSVMRSGRHRSHADARFSGRDESLADVAGSAEPPAPDTAGDSAASEAAPDRPRDASR